MGEETLSSLFQKRFAQPGAKCWACTRQVTFQRPVEVGDLLQLRCHIMHTDTRHDLGKVDHWPTKAVAELKVSQCLGKACTGNGARAKHRNSPAAERLHFLLSHRFSRV